MSTYTITETKREQSGQIVYFVRSPKGTEYAVHKGYSQWPWEVATLAKSAHGRVWRWAKDITKGVIADVVAFTQAHDETAQNRFDKWGNLITHKTHHSVEILQLCGDWMGAEFHSFATAEEAKECAEEIAKKNTNITRVLTRGEPVEIIGLNNAPFCYVGELAEGGRKVIAELQAQQKVKDEAAQQITVSLTVSDQFLRDVLCTAIEGGSNYWAIFRSKDIIEGEYTHEYTAATVCGTGETRDDFKPKRIGLPELREGVRVMLERGKCAPSYRETLLRAVIEDDAGNCDADLSDLILQSAMFDGDVVYG